MPISVPPDSYTAQDGQDYTKGHTADNAVVGDSAGTLSAKLRGISKVLNSIWSSANGWLVVFGQISASNETSTIYNGTTALVSKFALISASSSGVSILVAAVSLKKIRVTNIVLISNGAVNAKFQSHTTPTDLTGLLYLTTNTGFAPGYDPTGHFESLSGQSLDINLSAAIAVGGWIKYIEV